LKKSSPLTHTLSKDASTLAQLRGASSVVIQAVTGITHLVEQLHQTIVSLAPPVHTASKRPAAVHQQKKTKGITGLVYQSVRGITQGVGWGIDKGLAVAGTPAVAKLLEPLAKKLATRTAQPYRETVLAAVNGVLGDHLQASGNPLAIRMRLRQHGVELDDGKPLPSGQRPSAKLLVMVHGLCMNDLQWLREGHDHGAALALAGGYTPLYLHYNTGLPVADNGQALSDVLAQLVQTWPVPVQELVILGHSMGGLVSRSACHHAVQAGQVWTKKVSKLICLGTPHEGAPLERAGRWVDYLLAISPYSAPFARLGLVRSAGIQDLRYGRIVPPKQTAAWPKNISLYLVAASKQKTAKVIAQQSKARRPAQSETLMGALIGDGLVPVKSALGLGRRVSGSQPHAPFPVAAQRQLLVFNTDHFDLLSSAEVMAQLLAWLNAKPVKSAKPSISR
jgi:pimeloyl-ACP methyl ester carboxylesterase